MQYKKHRKTTGLFMIILTIIGIYLFHALAYAESSQETESYALLDRGPVVNAKMKTLTAGLMRDSWTETDDIKAVQMADTLPDSFVASAVNTISASNSKYPVYIFFDNKDGAGILYIYTEAKTVFLHPDSEYLLSCHTALTDISAIASWNTSRVNNMSGLLYGAKSLKSALALKDWDTSNVKDMSYLFSSDVSLEYVDISKWNTSKVTTMTCMFQVGDSHAGNGQLKEIAGLGDIDVSNVTDMTAMFYGAGQMTYYDIGKWNVSKVESMNHMFCDNYQLRSLDLSAWDVSNVKTMFCMFDDAQKLKTIGDVSHWNTVSLIDASGWLNDARSFIGDNLGALDLSGWNTANLKAVGEMFLNTKLHTIDLSGWSFDSITNDRWEGWGHGIYYEAGNGSEALKGFGQMFKGSADLAIVYVSQSGLDSFNDVVETGVNIEDMWTGTNVKEFTVK